MDSIEVKAYMCKKCHAVYNSKEAADRCCKQGICSVCGKDKESVYIPKCYSCMDREKYDSAHKISKDEYEKEYANYKVYWMGVYYDSIKQCIEDVYTKAHDAENSAYTKDDIDKLSYVWSTDTYEMSLDADYIWEDMMIRASDADEYTEPDGAYDDLREKIDDWNNKYAVEVYDKDYCLAVDIPEEYKRAVIEEMKAK